MELLVLVADHLAFLLELVPEQILQVLPKVDHVGWAQLLKENIPFQVSFPKCICICVLDVNNFSHNYNCICVLDVTHLGHKDTSICVLYDTHLRVKYCKDDLLQLVHVALTMQCVHLN